MKFTTALLAGTMMTAAFAPVLISVPALADYATGQAAMERKDYRTAAAEWRPAAKAGNINAEFGLGVLYLEGLGVKQDTAEAAKWIARAAEKNLAKAQMIMAVMCIRGAGVKKDLDKGISWYEKAAAQDLVPAQVNLGVIYASPKFGKQDYVRAVKWFTRAASFGHPIAEFNLGQLYRHGRGVPPDAAKAVDYYRRAAKQGYIPAEVALGAAYITGNGVGKPDLVKAFAWTRIAAAHGHPTAAKNLQYIDSHINPADKARGEKLAAQLKAEQREEKHPAPVRAEAQPNLPAPVVPRKVRPRL